VTTASTAELSARAELIAIATPIGEARIPGFRVSVWRLIEVLWGGWPYPTIDLLARGRAEPLAPRKYLLFAECNSSPVHWRAIDVLPATAARVREVRGLLR